MAPQELMLHYLHALSIFAAPSTHHAPEEYWTPLKGHDFLSFHSSPHTLFAGDRPAPISRTQVDSLDETWSKFLETPPQTAVEMAANLTVRAQSVADAFIQNGTVVNFLLEAKEFDVVCSGGGDLNAYYMGIEMVFSRARLSARELRHAGTSAGGWMSFERALKGEQRTLESYLSYGLLEEANPIHYSTVATAVLFQDHHWRMMAEWQANKWNSTLHELDGFVFLGCSCRNHTLFETYLLTVSDFPSPAAAAAAFIATGAVGDVKVHGLECTDGGHAAGAKMTNLFQDGLRPQVIIDLMQTGFPLEMGMGKFKSQQYVQLVERGQDEAAEFLRTGAVSRSHGAITWCPLGYDTSKNVCMQKHVQKADESEP